MGKMRYFASQDPENIKYRSDEEIDRFFRVVRKSRQGARDECLFNLMLSYGLRREELINLKLDHISSNGRQLFVKRVKQSEESQKRTSCWYNLSDKNIKLLKRWLKVRAKWPGADLPWLFISKLLSQKMNVGSINYLVKKYGKRANIEDLSPHQFRFTAGYRARRSGKDIQDIQYRLGHSSFVSSFVYTQLFGPDQVKRDKEMNEAIEDNK